MEDQAEAATVDPRQHETCQDSPRNEAVRKAAHFPIRFRFDPADMYCMASSSSWGTSAMRHPKTQNQRAPESSQSARNSEFQGSIRQRASLPFHCKSYG